MVATCFLGLEWTFGSSVRFSSFSDELMEFEADPFLIDPCAKWLLLVPFRNILWTGFLVSDGLVPAA